jgi:hypothetical protein
LTGVKSLAFAGARLLGGQGQRIPIAVAVKLRGRLPVQSSAYMFSPKFAQFTAQNTLFWLIW